MLNSFSFLLASSIRIHRKLLNVVKAEAGISSRRVCRKTREGNATPPAVSRSRVNNIILKVGVKFTKLSRSLVCFAYDRNKWVETEGFKRYTRINTNSRFDGRRVEKRRVEKWWKSRILGRGRGGAEFWNFSISRFYGSYRGLISPALVGAVTRVSADKKILIPDRWNGPRSSWKISRFGWKFNGSRLITLKRSFRTNDGSFIRRLIIHNLYPLRDRDK